MSFDAINSLLISPLSDIPNTYPVTRNITKIDFAHILRGPFDVDTVLDLLPRRRIKIKLSSIPCFGGDAQCVYAPAERTRSARVAHDERRKEFVSAAKEELISRWQGVFSSEDLLAQISNYDIHHKKPIWMWGSNDFGNLVLIDRALHKAMHDEIRRTLGEIKHILTRHQSSKRPRKTNLFADLSKIKHVSIRYKRKIYMDVPFPQYKVCIPQLVAFENQLRGRPILNDYSLIANEEPQPQLDAACGLTTRKPDSIRLSL